MYSQYSFIDIKGNGSIKQWKRKERGDEEKNCIKEYSFAMNTNQYIFALRYSPCDPLVDNYNNSVSHVC